LVRPIFVSVLNLFSGNGARGASLPEIAGGGWQNNWPEEKWW